VPAALIHTDGHEADARFSHLGERAYKRQGAKSINIATVTAT